MNSWKLKVHFVIHSFIPPFFSKKVEIFVLVEAFRYIMFVQKIFLANLIIVWQNITEFVYFSCRHGNSNVHIVAYATVWCSKTCIAHKRNLRINWKFGNKLISSISTEQCHKNSTLGLQNEPLTKFGESGNLCMHSQLLITMSRA